MRRRCNAWCIKNPNGQLLLMTLSTRQNCTKRRLLDPVEQKYHALVNSNFKKWEEVGYRAVRVYIKEKEND